VAAAAVAQKDITASESLGAVLALEWALVLVFSLVPLQILHTAVRLRKLLARACPSRPSIRRRATAASETVDSPVRTLGRRNQRSFSPWCLGGDFRPALLGVCGVLAWRCERVGWVYVGKARVGVES
jgi:hypothetical protein